VSYTQKNTNISTDPEASLHLNVKNFHSNFQSFLYDKTHTGAQNDEEGQKAPIFKGPTTITVLKRTSNRTWVGGVIVIV
jgi:hypothetical protein